MKAIVSIVIGAIGLLMSSCGLLFLGASFGGSGAGGVWPIAVPCVIGGGVLIWAAVALWRSWRKPTKAATPASLPSDTG